MKQFASCCLTLLFLLSCVPAHGTWAGNKVRSKESKRNKAHYRAMIKGQESTDPEKIYHAAMAFRNGWERLKRHSRSYRDVDMVKSRKLMDKAAAMGHPGALWQLFLCYETDVYERMRGGCKYDLEKADGRIIPETAQIKPNPKTAGEYLIKSAKAGGYEAQLILAKFMVGLSEHFAIVHRLKGKDLKSHYTYRHQERFPQFSFDDWPEMEELLRIYTTGSTPGTRFNNQHFVVRLKKSKSHLESSFYMNLGKAIDNDNKKLDFYHKALRRSSLRDNKVNLLRGISKIYHGLGDKDNAERYNKMAQTGRVDADEIDRIDQRNRERRQAKKDREEQEKNERIRQRRDKAIANRKAEERAARRIRMIQRDRENIENLRRQGPSGGGTVTFVQGQTGERKSTGGCTAPDYATFQAPKNPGKWTAADEAESKRRGSERKSYLANWADQQTPECRRQHLGSGGSGKGRGEQK